MYLETQRILIRDFEPEDAADLQDILGDSETMALFPRGNGVPPYVLVKKISQND